MRIAPHIWWKILPNDDESVDTFTFSSGQRWEYLLPLMMEHGLVWKKEGNIDVISNEWQKFSMHDEVDKTIHHTFYRPRTGPKVWYICRGVPSYPGPAQQLRAEKSAKFAYSTLKMSNRYDAQLNHKLKSYMSKSFIIFLHNNIAVEDDA
jgi:hypothetical protein